MRIAARLALVGAFAVIPFGASTARALGEPPKRGYSAGSSLGAIASELAASVFGLAPGAAVIGLTPSGGGPSLRPDVAIRLAVLVAARLGHAAAAWPYVESASHAHTLPHGARPLVLLEARLDGDRISVSAEVLAAEPPAQNAPPTTLGRFVAHGALDAEVRSFLPAVRLAVSELKPLVGTDNDVLALACADANGDGVPEVATLSRTRVTLGTLTGSRYAFVKSRSWAELSPVAARPLREPFASSTFTPRGELLVGISDRARAARLGTKLESLEPPVGAPLPWPGGGCARLEDLFISPRLERCDKSEAVLETPALRDPLDAFAGASLPLKNGDPRAVRAGRRAADGSVTLTDGEREVRLQRAGAQLAVGDLDGDGTVELVTSVDTADPATDAVIAYFWLGAALVEKLRVNVPTGVKALAICPQRAAAFAPIVVAASNGVWVIR